MDVEVRESVRTYMAFGLSETAALHAAQGDSVLESDLAALKRETLSDDERQDINNLMALGGLTESAARIAAGIDEFDFSLQESAPSSPQTHTLSEGARETFGVL